MGDETKTKDQLLQENASLRESLQQCNARLQARRQDLDDLAHYIVSEFKRPLGAIIGYAGLLEQDYATLSPGDLRHCAQTIRQGGESLGEMVNVLLLLSMSHRVFDNVWHAAYLATLNETSLSQWAEELDVPEAYRFTCLPASSVPLVVRAWTTAVNQPGCTVIAKVGAVPAEDETGGSSPPHENQWALDPEAWERLTAAVGKSGFWTDSSTLEPLGWLQMVGAGGEEWVFEGWRDGQYKARAVWSPGDEQGHAAYALGRTFVKLLPGEFALTMARFWAAHVGPDAIHPQLGEAMGL